MLMQLTWYVYSENIEIAVLLTIKCGINLTIWLIWQFFVYVIKQISN